MVIKFVKKIRIIKFKHQKRTIGTRCIKQTLFGNKKLFKSNGVTFINKKKYHTHSNIGQDFGGGYLHTGHRRDGLFYDDAPPRILVTGASGQIGTGMFYVPCFYVVFILHTNENILLKYLKQLFWYRINTIFT